MKQTRIVSCVFTKIWMFMLQNSSMYKICWQSTRLFASQKSMNEFQADKWRKPQNSTQGTSSLLSFEPFVQPMICQKRTPKYSHPKHGDLPFDLIQPASPISTRTRCICEKTVGSRKRHLLISKTFLAGKVQLEINLKPFFVTTVKKCCYCVHFFPMKSTFPSKKHRVLGKRSFCM